MLSGPQTVPSSSAPKASGPVVVAESSELLLTGPLYPAGGYVNVAWSGACRLEEEARPLSAPLLSGGVFRERHITLKTYSGPLSVAQALPR